MEENKETVTIKKETLWKYSTFVFAAAFLVALFIALSGDDRSPTTGNVGNTGQQQLPAQNARVEVSLDDDAVRGDEDAPVTIIEFSDFQCPFCRKFWTETLSQIENEYVKTGKVKFVFRDFPLVSLHPSAQVSAEAAECAREVGKGDEAFWKFHDKIFTETNILDSGSPTGAVTKTAQYGATELKKWAKELGYNIDSCLDSGKYKSEVQKDQTDGSAVGVQGTPAFFIGNDKDGYKSLSGAQPFANFKSVIDAELA